MILGTGRERKCAGGCLRVTSQRIAANDPQDADTDVGVTECACQGAECDPCLFAGRVEVHVEERHVQSSLLIKLVAARCINSALLIYLATDYKDTFGKYPFL